MKDKNTNKKNIMLDSAPQRRVEETDKENHNDIKQDQ